MERNYLQLSRELYKNRKYEEALKYINKEIKRNPKSSTALRQKGLMLSELSRYSESIKFFDKALELDPLKPGWLVEKALTLMHSGKYEGALELCYQAMKMQPNAYWNEIAAIHERFKNFDAALECIEKAIIKNPNSDYFRSVRSAIMNGLEYGKNFHIPIARSLLLYKLPNEDTIIYTTRIIIKMLNSNLKVDAIMTNVGIKTFIPHTGLRYIPWEKIQFLRKGAFSLSSFKCNLLFDPRFESKVNFDNRKREFNEYISKMRAKLDI
ncbi:MAG: tetratricopeptide repeat protein [Promethearchaeota archaeon]